LAGGGSIACHYVTAIGEATAEANCNSVIDNIAGILGRNRRMLGMMPHLKNLVDLLKDGIDRLPFFESIAGVFTTA
jgi:phosphoribosylformylglycinamidine synthase